MPPADAIRWDQPNRLTFFSGGVDGDVSLASLPAGIVIDDAWLETSWRKKSVTAHLRVRSAGEAAQAVDVTIDIRTHREHAPAKRFKSRQTLKAGVNAIDLAEPWDNATPWSLANPYLYEFTVTLADAAGNPLDATFPVRFGFREIWIDGGDFMLNGTPVHFIGHSNSHLTSAAELGDPEYIRYSLRQWAKAGINCVTPWQGEDRYPTFHPLLDGADELGMAIFPNVNLPTGEYEPADPAVQAQWNRLYQVYIERYRQHPSVLGWMIGSGANHLDFCPSAMDGGLAVDVPRAGPLRATWEAARKFDPTSRPIFGLSEGNIGPVWTSMAYQGFDEDLQQRENWPLAWSRERAKPLMPCEFSLPFPSDWLARSDERTARANYYPPDSQSLATEYAAMLLGPGVYQAESADYVRTLGESPGTPQRSASFWPVKMLFADTLRAWRAYGMSFIYHAEVPGMFSGARPAFPTVAKLDPRRWSATPEDLAGSLQAADELSLFGQRIRDLAAPVIAFIGGAAPDGRFTMKDHAFWAGEPVRKCLVVVNDSPGPIDLQTRWLLRESASPQGKPIDMGLLSVHVDPGRQETTKAVIAFDAPAVGARTDFVLSVAAWAGKSLTVPVEPFTFTVFPRATQKPPASAPDDVVLFDPAGRTRAALATLGRATGAAMRLTSMPDRLTGRTRLIVGSRALEKPADRKALADAGFDQAVGNGVRVLVFEQASPDWDGRLMGLRLKRLATRRTFVRAAGHPALAGLGEADFRFLRGDSDLIEPYPRVTTMPAEYPVHFWHWGNDNIVGTFAIEKPQVGAACAILDCGFDLNETVLLETARGRGRIVFCQVDVTNRVGPDPVSTRLVGNLVDYLCQPNPAALVPVTPGAAADLLRQSPPRDTIDAFVSQTPPIAGIHAGDTFFRERLRLAAFDANSPTPLFRQENVDGRTVWATSLSAADLKTDWQRAKLARIEAALRLVNGESSADGPMLLHFDDVGRLYPFHWNRLPRMAADFDPYVYWRW